MESSEARLSFSIIGDGIHEHADPPHPLRLLRPCRERPCRRAAKRDNELPPSNMDCHVTLPWGSCNGGDDITPGRAALRDFKPAYDCSGSSASIALRTRVRLSPDFGHAHRECRRGSFVRALGFTVIRIAGSVPL